MAEDDLTPIPADEVVDDSPLDPRTSQERIRQIVADLLEVELRAGHTSSQDALQGDNPSTPADPAVTALDADILRLNSQRQFWMESAIETMSAQPANAAVKPEVYEKMRMDWEEHWYNTTKGAELPPNATDLQVAQHDKDVELKKYELAKQDIQKWLTDAGLANEIPRIEAELAPLTTLKKGDEKILTKEEMRAVHIICQNAQLQELRSMTKAGPQGMIIDGSDPKDNEPKVYTRIITNAADSASIDAVLQDFPRTRQGTPIAYMDQPVDRADLIQNGNPQVIAWQDAQNVSHKLVIMSRQWALIHGYDSTLELNGVATTLTPEQMEKLPQRQRFDTALERRMSDTKPASDRLPVEGPKDFQAEISYDISKKFYEERQKTRQLLALTPEGKAREVLTQTDGMKTGGVDKKAQERIKSYNDYERKKLSEGLSSVYSKAEVAAFLKTYDGYIKDPKSLKAAEEQIKEEVRRLEQGDPSLEELSDEQAPKKAPAPVQKKVGAVSPVAPGISEQLPQLAIRLDSGDHNFNTLSAPASTGPKPAGPRVGPKFSV